MDYYDVMFFLNHFRLPCESEKAKEIPLIDYQMENYRRVDGQIDTYINIHQDFTDKYVVCEDCKRYVPLGNVTTPLKEIMICNHQTHFKYFHYFDADDSALVSSQTAYESWNSYWDGVYSNPDYHPWHHDDYMYESDIFKE